MIARAHVTPGMSCASYSPVRPKLRGRGGWVRADSIRPIGTGRSHREPQQRVCCLRALDALRDAKLDTPWEHTRPVVGRRLVTRPWAMVGLPPLLRLWRFSLCAARYVLALRLSRAPPSVASGDSRRLAPSQSSNAFGAPEVHRGRAYQKSGPLLSWGMILGSLSM